MAQTKPKRDTEGLDFKELSLDEAVARIETELEHAEASFTANRKDPSESVAKVRRTLKQFRRQLRAGAYSGALSGSAVAFVNPDGLADQIAQRRGWDDEVGEGLVADVVGDVLGVVNQIRKTVDERPVTLHSDRRRKAPVLLHIEDTDDKLAMELDADGKLTVAGDVDPEDYEPGGESSDETSGGT